MKDLQQNFRLVTKADNYHMAIFIVMANGDYKEICRVLLPTDNQIQDNAELAEEICTALKKRIRKTME